MAASMLQQSQKHNNQINKDKAGWILGMNFIILVDSG